MQLIEKSSLHDELDTARINIHYAFLNFSSSFYALVLDPTFCEKTQFTLRLIANATTVIQPPPRQIVWCYRVYQNLLITCVVLMSNCSFIRTYLSCWFSMDVSVHCLILITWCMKWTTTSQIFKQKLVIIWTFLCYI